MEPTTQPLSNDPASAVASQSAPLFTTFFAFLGEDSKDPDWAKFETNGEAAPVDGAETPAKPSGVVWLLGHLQEEKKELVPTGTEASDKLRGAFDKAIKVSQVACGSEASD